MKKKCENLRASKILKIGTSVSKLWWKISKLKKTLQQAQSDAMCATKNPNIFEAIDENWSTLNYEDRKSLARVLHEEEGWTSNMLDELVFIWKTIFFIIFDWAFGQYFWQSFSAMEISAHHWSKVNPGVNERY